ncbi:MAG: EamA family transporter [Candidatus Eremiobacteraeota bacterium]|nr:EamA family transporter [Candidatus Eremiobacteraeota bacterium]
MAAAGLYGSADFLGGLAAKRGPMLTVTLAAQAIGLVCLLGVVPFYGGHPARAELLWSAAGGIFGGIGIALLYHALAIGKMGVVSPVTAIVAAAFPVTAGVVRGDPLAWFQKLGIAVALAAVVLVSLSKEDGGEREIATTGVKEAIASGIALGILFLALGAGQRSGGFDGLLAARIGSVACLLVLAVVLRVPLRPPRLAFGAIVASGAIDMAANVCYVIAAQTGALAIASVLTSLYPASTVFLARFVLGERLAAVQKTGVALALIGVALIAA